VHLWPSAIEADPAGQAARVRRAIDAAGLSGCADMITQLGTSFRDRPINSPDPAVREANRRRFRAMLEFARQAGVPGITVLPGVVHADLGRERSFDLAVAELGVYVGMAREAGVRLSTEAHRESVVEPLSVERTLELVERVPGLLLTLDYSHFVSAGVAEREVDRLIPSTAHFHARQAAPGRVQADHWTGTLDFRTIVGKLKESGYNGAICVEYTWQEWQGCHDLDVVSESILLRDELLRYLGT
jgi:sugar phosphate isomerase/epimerase